MSWTDNGSCRGHRKVAVDYDTYFPAKGGHVTNANDSGDFELDEIDAGAQCVSALCVQCREWIGIMMANDIEYGGDETPYIPKDPQQWRRLNHLN